jgi:alanyl-tRNA synthetase
MSKKWTGSEIRQSFIDYFVAQGHTFVPSASLVPGGDQTLLFTNAGMVQFKDVFLGTDRRAYTRAVNSQKCMRVAGKHNDLDDVGRDDSHHTFFEMLGNWSFGDYYKKDAIYWAWDLLTRVWGLDKGLLWATCFKDDRGEIPSDEEAAAAWRDQPGLIPEHVLTYGRKDNFWEMADTGPCGPCSEIHIDLGAEFCNKKGEEGHICRVNGDCKRFLELWNLVFIQYNRTGPNDLQPLPATHVDTGMGFERIVSVLQGVYSNYKTDLIYPLIQTVQEMTGHDDTQRDVDITPYRVIADHARAAAFLIADGVVPGNTGRNYICRMIIRRAARFGAKIGLHQPFMAKVAEKVIEIYGDFYPELRKNARSILDSLTREEKRFDRTVEAGMGHLEALLLDVKKLNENVLSGASAFDLYATHGLPLELTRDVAREQGMDVDEDGFRSAMTEHRLASGAGKAFGPMGGEDADLYRQLFEELQIDGKLGKDGVSYDPYTLTSVTGEILAIIKGGFMVVEAAIGEQVDIILPATCFYIESGGQVADNGIIRSVDGSWCVEVNDVRRPAAGIVIHSGIVTSGRCEVGSATIAEVDGARRKDIMRNHTATHLLHAELHRVLGDHARQAGSLVAPDRLRFDFTHPDALTPEQLVEIATGVNLKVYADDRLSMKTKPLAEAISEGAMALFGEKYGETVRTITIGEGEPYSYELCGGTHVDQTGDIGLFIITSEGSTAAGVRRIEAVTGKGAYEVVKKHESLLRSTASILGSAVDEVPAKASIALEELSDARKQIQLLRQQMAYQTFEKTLNNAVIINSTPVIISQIDGLDADTLRLLSDRFRTKYPSGVVVLGTVQDNRPVIVASVSEDLVKRGVHAGELVKFVAQFVDGSGGGRPTLAQAGGKNPERLSEALDQANSFLKSKL